MPTNPPPDLLTGPTFADAHDQARAWYAAEHGPIDSARARHLFERWFARELHDQAAAGR